MFKEEIVQHYIIYQPIIPPSPHHCFCCKENVLSTSQIQMGSVSAVTQFYSIKTMDMVDSRASLQAKNMKSTRGSFFTKATGRQVKASWGNRILKDFNDLQYDISIDRFSRQNRFKNADILKRQKRQADINNRRTSKKKISIGGGSRESLPKSRNRARMSDSLPLPNPERIYVGSIESPEDQSYGLCTYEYMNTIKGKMEKRSNHHLSFEKNKINRIVNENPIHYNRHLEIDYSFSQLMSERKRSKKYHPFASYTDRRVFEPREELDKFYDQEQARKVASPMPKSRQAVRRFDKVPGRTPPRLNESATLCYDTIPCLEMIESSTQKYSIPHSERETSFSRQVINPRRGCYR